MFSNNYKFKPIWMENIDCKLWLQSDWFGRCQLASISLLPMRMTNLGEIHFEVSRQKMVWKCPEISFRIRNLFPSPIHSWTLLIQVFWYTKTTQSSKVWSKFSEEVEGLSWGSQAQYQWGASGSCSLKSDGRIGSRNLIGSSGNALRKNLNWYPHQSESHH